MLRRDVARKRLQTTDSVRHLVYTNLHFYTGTYLRQKKTEMKILRSIFFQRVKQSPCDMQRRFVGTYYCMYDSNLFGVFQLGQTMQFSSSRVENV